MNKKLLTSLLCFLLVISTLAGCGVKLSDTSLYVHKDGSIEAAVYEPFDTKVYQEADLVAFLEETVGAYNQAAANVTAVYAKDSKESIPVAIDSVKVESDQAIMNMIYASSEDYIAFNEGDASITELICGKVADQAALGCNLSEFSLVNADGESYSETLSDTANFVVVEGDKKILVEGKIICVSKGVVVEDKKTVTITPEAGRCLIVFSK